MVFDRMGNDLAAMVRRTDVNYIFYKNGNCSDSRLERRDVLLLRGSRLSKRERHLGNGHHREREHMALVGYRINQYNTFYTPESP